MAWVPVSAAGSPIRTIWKRRACRGIPPNRLVAVRPGLGTGSSAQDSEDVEKLAECWESEELEESEELDQPEESEEWEESEKSEK